MNIGFVIDDLKEIKPQSNTTLRLIHECVKRKFTVGLLYPQNFIVENNSVHCIVKVIKPMDKIPKEFDKFLKKIVCQDELIKLTNFDAIFVRKDPPIDNIMLNFLDSISDDVFILNSVSGMKKANNKLYTTNFFDPNNEFLPKTYVSKNRDYLKSIIQNFGKKMVLKPLEGYGGSGVIVLDTDNLLNINSLIDFYIAGKNYVVLQEYIEDAKNGDIRVLMLNGKPIGAMKRVPADDEMRANVHAGGIAQKYTLTKQDLQICNIVGQKLVEDGLYFVGIDIIDGKLIEANVVSPGGIVNINRLNNTNLQKKVINFVVDEVNNRKALKNA